MDVTRRRHSSGVGGEYVYLLEQARALGDRYRRRRFPALSICVFDHEPGDIAPDGKTTASALIVIVDGAPCTKFDGHRRTASQKG